MADYDWAKVRMLHVEMQKDLFKLQILDGAEAFKLSDTHGLPLEIIRLLCRRQGVLVDEWGLRLSMYLAGRDVPKPKLGLIPRRAEEND